MTGYFLITENYLQYIKGGTGYPHDGRADNAAYRHDRRADNRRYPHDREIEYPNVKYVKKLIHFKLKNILHWLQIGNRCNGIVSLVEYVGATY